MFLFRATYLQSQGRSMENIANARISLSAGCDYENETEKIQRRRMDHSEWWAQRHTCRPHGAKLLPISNDTFSCDTEKLIVRRGATLCFAIDLGRINLANTNLLPLCRFRNYFGSFFVLVPLRYLNVYVISKMSLICVNVWYSFCDTLMEIECIAKEIIWFN